MKRSISGVELLIDNVWDDHNGHSLWLTVNGFGIEQLDLYYTYNTPPKFPKTEDDIAVYTIENLQEFVAQKKQQQYVFIGADFDYQAQQLNKYSFPKRCILVLGSEKRGISPEVKAICDQIVFIPMVGMVKSFNISVSAAIFCYEVFRQKHK